MPPSIVLLKVKLKWKTEKESEIQVKYYVISCRIKVCNACNSHAKESSKCDQLRRIIDDYTTSSSSLCSHSTTNGTIILCSLTQVIYANDRRARYLRCRKHLTNFRNASHMSFFYIYVRSHEYCIIQVES